jgi:hypothetical protein
MRRCYNDLEEATEWGACALALLVMRALTGYDVVECSRRGTGFDYWLGTGNSAPFPHMSKLEVSGIRHGDTAMIAARMSSKRRQTETAVGQEPVFIVVVEFSEPRAQVEER